MPVRQTHAPWLRPSELSEHAELPDTHSGVWEQASAGPDLSNGFPTLRSLPPMNPDAASCVSKAPSVGSSVSHAISQMERGKSPPSKLANRPLPPKKPFAGIPVQFQRSPISGPMPSFAVPSSLKVGKPKTADIGSKQNSEYMSIASGSGSGQSSMSYPNSDEWKDPNQHHLGYPAKLSAPSKDIVPDGYGNSPQSSSRRSRFLKELDKLRFIRFLNVLKEF